MNWTHVPLICSDCMVSYMMTTRKTTCPYCRTSFDHLLFADKWLDRLTFNKAFSYPEIGKLLKDLDGLKIRISIQSEKVKKKLMLATEPICKKCKKIFPTVEAYKRHMFKKHNLHYCTLCQKDELIIRKIKFYNDIEELRAHQSEVVNGKVLHPSCKFWTTVFRNISKYQKHVQTTHYFCNACYKNGDKENTVFGNFISYRDHVHECHMNSDDLDLIDLELLNSKLSRHSFLLKPLKLNYRSKNARVRQLVTVRSLNSIGR